LLVQRDAGAIGHSIQALKATDDGCRINQCVGSHGHFQRFPGFRQALFVTMKRGIGEVIQYFLIGDADRLPFIRG
jgi:hypothetical protein